MIGQKDVVPVLLDYMENVEDRHLKKDIILTLMWLKDERSVDPLINVLKNDDYSFNRGGAITALGHIGDKKAIPYLEKALNDESEFNRNYARSALFAITGKDYKIKEEE